MKALLKKNVESSVYSFTMTELNDPYFDPNWHFHPHYQLFSVFEGEGTRFIGDDIRHFEPGDTVFLGPNLPHLWRSDKNYFEGNNQLKTRGIVIYFTEDFLGKDFFEKPEMYSLKQLLANSFRGMDIKGEMRTYLRESMQNLLQENGFDCVLKLLEILNKLSHSNDFEYITSLGYVNTHKVSETERMQKVHEYVMKHFKQEIRLNEVASLAGMSEAAFCRYFKNRTNKTFSDFVSGVRIGHACKLLLADRMTVLQICYESGFNTVSNFNRQFKTITGKTPVTYQKEYLQASNKIEV
ncbi:AraC-type DNA-binding protein [Pseudarcicella hirudinis]|uniref:AraC-type DNA-binding protein n=1 Tax=Pseudarcicella hirudinis TaxID=1079859 RepID=A0A1I5XWZ0_9BACT|nr:AraC family transcriptional regulator [Pseudarcicella hirudinis]SFQ36390.1 AraC-type DNA-binding protein [Pseudarcicella hirudinis]